MVWGGIGGHEVSKWTHYRDTKVFGVLVETSQQLPVYRFRVLVLMAGHYPW